MLFRYGNKVYVRPFANKLVEVKVEKNGSEYDVKPTTEKLEITNEVNEGLYSITLEEAYDIQHKSATKVESSLKSRKLFKE